MILIIKHLKECIESQQQERSFLAPIFLINSIHATLILSADCCMNWDDIEIDFLQKLKNNFYIVSVIKFFLYRLSFL